MTKPIAFADALNDARFWMKVVNLNIHKRFSHPLMTYGFKHVFDLVQQTEADLLALRTFGPSGVAAVKSALTELGLSLATEIEFPPGDHAAEIAAARARFASISVPHLGLKPEPSAPPSLSPSVRIGTKLLQDAGLSAEQVAMIAGCPRLREELATFCRAAAGLTERLGTNPLAAVIKRPDNIVVGLKLLAQDDSTP